MKPGGHHSATIRGIALFEAAKGAVVFLAGFGFVTLVHHDVARLAGLAIGRLHLDPTRTYPHIFLEAAARTTDARLMTYAALAATYGVFRLLEAYGLWNERRWAEWLAAVSAGIYIPFELWHLAHHTTWIAAATLALNAAIVAVMVRTLLRRSRLRSPSRP
jgi:uncharacterized membrane protein (DUF2068 family)